MRRTPTLFLHLELGLATYEFRRCFPGLPWNAVAGLYAFVAWPAKLLYLGETTNFAARLPGHEMWPQARRLGARHVYAMPFSGTSGERRALERALIGAYTPECNTQHRAAGLAEREAPGLWFDPFDSFDAFVRQVR